MEEGIEDNEDNDVGGLMPDESINTIAGDEYLRPKSKQLKVVFTLDNSEIMKTGTKEEEDDGSSSSFQEKDYNFIRRTLDYDEDNSDSEIFDDPSVIEEADRVENAIKHNLTFLAVSMFALKVFNKIMQCLFGDNGDIQQELTTHAMDDLTNTSVSNSVTLGGGGGGGQGGAAAQAQ